MCWYFHAFRHRLDYRLDSGAVSQLFEKKLKVRRKAGSVFVIVVVIGLVVLAGYLVGSKLIREGIRFVEDLPEMWASTQGDLDRIAKKFSIVYEKLPVDVQNTMNNFGSQISNTVAAAIGKLSSPTIAAVGNFAKQLPSIIIGIIMCLLSSYFLWRRETGSGVPLPNTCRKALWDVSG